MLSQEDADILARTLKRIVSGSVLVVPIMGQKETWEAESYEHERFLLDVRRGRKRIVQVTLQERYQGNEILVRVDYDGPPHMNPDGTIIETPHVHLYRAGYNDRWAFPLPPELIGESGSAEQILHSFLAFCGVDPIPPIHGGVV